MEELQGAQEGTWASPPLACPVTSAHGSSPLCRLHFMNRPQPPLRSPQSRDHLPLGRGGWVWAGLEGTSMEACGKAAGGLGPGPLLLRVIWGWEGPNREAPGVGRPPSSLHLP